MYNRATIIGTVRQVITEDRATYVIVDDKSNPQYPVTVAVRCWSAKTKEAAGGLAQGQLVSVEGTIKSRQGKEGGRFFTDFEALFVKAIEAPKGEREPGADDVDF